jgi:cytochrome P450
VVGRDRLPTFADARRLSCVRATIKDNLRLRPTIALGFPHATTEEDWCEGMFIPKGTLRIPNLRHCNHDRAVFGEDADGFRPVRHLDEHGESLSGPVETNRAGHVAFGFGRRICVGKEMAYDSLFIDTVRMLWAAIHERTRDEKKGKEVPVDVETMVEAGVAL